MYRSSRLLQRQAEVIMEERGYASLTLARAKVSTLRRVRNEIVAELERAAKKPKYDDDDEPGSPESPSCDGHNNVPESPSFDGHNNVPESPSFDGHNRVPESPSFDGHDRVPESPSFDGPR